MLASHVRPPLGTNFNILTVCTGNICRSPLGEALLRNELSNLPIVVSSAGTQALAGEPMYKPIQEIAREFGLNDDNNHRARQLTVDMLKQSDLILAMDRGHRRSVVEMLPRVSRYTFTIREFSRLANRVANEDLELRDGLSEVELLRRPIELVAQLRGTLPLLDDPMQDDVVDPFRKDKATCELSASQLAPAVSDISALFKQTIGAIW